MILGSIRIALVFLIMSIGLDCISQSNNQLVSDLRSYFIKPEMKVEIGQLGFNVIRVVNEGPMPIEIKPLLEVPEGFSTFTTSFQNKTIAVGDSAIFPFRIKISNEAVSGKKHEIIFRAFDSQSKLVLENVLYILPEEFHDWEIIVPPNNAYFYPRFNLAEFDIIVSNKGNTPELIKLEISPSNSLEIKEVDGSRWQENRVVYIPQNTDTIIKLKASYSGNNNRIYDLNKVHINASVGDEKKYRAITIEKYKDEYDPFFVDNTLPHSIEAGFRSDNLQNKYSPFIKARGNSEFKNQSSFSYYYTNYRLDQTQNILRSSNYRFLYSKNTLNIGVGAFGSQLGRNMYSQNALMVSYGLEVGKNSLFEGYASQDFLDPITSGAVGYIFDNKDWNLKSSIGYNYDGLRKMNTTSIRAMTNNLPLFKGHSLDVIVNALREDYYLFNPFSLQGVAWDINWNGRFGSRIRYRLKNTYGSPNMPGQQMGLLGFSGKVEFQTYTILNYWSFEAYSIRRKFHEFNLYGDKTPEIFLQDSYANILYNSHSNPKFTYSIGPSIEWYRSHRPSLKDFEYADYDIKKIHLEMRFMLKKHLSFTLLGGFRDINYTGDIVIIETKPDIHLSVGYGKNGYGITAYYNYGSMVSRGLYQFPKDMSYDGFVLSPYVYKSFGNGRFNLQLFGSINYRQDLNFFYTTINPYLEVFLARNWYLNARGSYAYYMQENSEFVSQKSSHFVELSIKKKFGKSDFYNKEKDLKRLKVICFKDENNNGRKDKGEEGIEMVKVRMKLIDEEKQPGHKMFPIDIALLTNDKGNVIFNRIQKGFYQLEVEPLGDMQEYFYVSEEHEYVELIKNTTFYIPFQKANRIIGKIEAEKTKYSNKQILDLGNIKVTAYNQAGNSYSSFTLNDGSFTLFAPGDTIYYIRLNDIFGDKYKILQNDIMKRVPDPTNTPVIFNVVEKTRKINFKKATPNQPGTENLKIKVLEGKIYENTDERVSQDAEPDFDIGGGTSFEITLKVGKHYVILAKANTEDEALEAAFYTMDKGIDAYFGYDENSKKYYVVLGEYNSAFDAQTAAQKASEAGVAVNESIFYK